MPSAADKAGQTVAFATALRVWLRIGLLSTKFNETFRA